MRAGPGGRLRERRALRGYGGWPTLRLRGRQPLGRRPLRRLRRVRPRLQTPRLPPHHSLRLETHAWVQPRPDSREAIAPPWRRPSRCSESRGGGHAVLRVPGGRAVPAHRQVQDDGRVGAAAAQPRDAITADAGRRAARGAGLAAGAGATGAGRALRAALAQTVSPSPDPRPRPRVPA